MSASSHVFAKGGDRRRDNDFVVSVLQPKWSRAFSVANNLKFVFCEFTFRQKGNRRIIEGERRRDAFKEIFSCVVECFCSDVFARKIS
jgi:hypothetical protein